MEIVASVVVESLSVVRVSVTITDVAAIFSVAKSVVTERVFTATSFAANVSIVALSEANSVAVSVDTVACEIVALEVTLRVSITATLELMFVAVITPISVLALVPTNDVFTLSSSTSSS